MAHPVAVAYLRENKDRFPLARLREKLLAQGYPESVIAKAVAEVYGSSAASEHPPGASPRGFFDFRHPAVYATVGLKAWDCIAGLFLGGALSFIQLVASEVAPFRNFYLGGIILIGLRAALLALFFWRRRWMGWGLLAASLLAWSSLVRPVLSFFEYGYYF